MKNLLLLPALIVLHISVFPQENKVIKLPEPQLDKGIPLMQAFEKRHSTRNFSERDIPMQELANLLWAANGINRKESGKRTVPTARNRQDIDVYVCNKEGVFRYDAQEHALVTINNHDIRSMTGTQAYVATAPANLIIVSDLDKMEGDRESNLQTANVEAGFVSQDIYLYCASENMATVVRGSIDRDKLAVEMELKPNQYIVVGQTVGYPAE